MQLYQVNVNLLCEPEPAPEKGNPDSLSNTHLMERLRPSRPDTTLSSRLDLETRIISQSIELGSWFLTRNDKNPTIVLGLCFSNGQWQTKQRTHIVHIWAVKLESTPMVRRSPVAKTHLPYCLRSVTSVKLQSHLSHIYVDTHKQSALLQILHN